MLRGAPLLVNGSAPLKWSTRICRVKLSSHEVTCALMKAPLSASRFPHSAFLCRLPVQELVQSSGPDILIVIIKREISDLRL